FDGLRQLGKHGSRVEARAGDEVGGVEAVGLVGINDGADGLHLYELRPILVMLGVSAAQLVELVLAPDLFAFLVPTAIRPDHERRAALRIAKATGEKALSLASCLLGALGEKDEDVGDLARGQVAETMYGRLGFGHDDGPQSADCERLLERCQGVLSLGA